MMLKKVNLSSHCDMAWFFYFTVHVRWFLLTGQSEALDRRGRELSSSAAGKVLGTKYNLSFISPT